MPCRRKNLFLVLAALTLSLFQAAALRADDAIRAQLLRTTGWVVVPKGAGYCYGSCWVVDRDKRLVMTNQHVVGDAPHLWVYFPIKQKEELLLQSADYLRLQAHFLGKVLARDKKRDLALVQLDKLPVGVQVLPLAEKCPRLGHKVYSLGNSGMAHKPINDGCLWQFREGCVRRVAFAVWTLSIGGERVEARTIDSDSGVCPGDSGGPLVNAQGQLVGIVSSFEGRRSKSIEISEIRTFLATFREGPRPTKSPLEGNWTVFYKNAEGCEYCFSLTFAPTGDLVWDGEKSFTGHFRYQKGMLHIDIPGLELREDWQLHWRPDSCFTFTRGETAYSCCRR